MDNLEERTAQFMADRAAEYQRRADQAHFDGTLLIEGQLSPQAAAASLFENARHWQRLATGAASVAVDGMTGGVK